MRKAETILLVEDDENDIFFFERALQTSGLPFVLSVVRSGAEAQDYMTGEGKFSDRQKHRFPKFIITDNNLPGSNGSSFLKWLKAHNRFHVVPTIILSGSDLAADVLKAYDELGVHSYIVKPLSGAELAETLELILKYWSRCSVPPTLQDNEEAERASAAGVALN